MPKDHGIGASSKRREDVRFLTGRGRYTDDINLRGQTHAVFVRSQVAHGRIRSIDTAAAEAMPGVLKVFTAKDFEGAEERRCAHEWMGGKGMRGGDYLDHLALPNFHFHLVTAYSILRHNGVELGKTVFIGHLPLV